MSFSASMVAKRSALIAFVRDTLDAALAAAGSATTFTVSERMRADVLNARTAADARHVMGEPVRYAIVENVGTAEEGPMTRAGTAGLVSHLYLVVGWLEFADADDYEDSSQALFDAVMEGQDADAPGLLPALRDLSHLDTADEGICEVGQPAEAALTLVRLGATTDQVYAHRFEFTITLT